MWGGGPIQLLGGGGRRWKAADGSEGKGGGRNNENVGDRRKGRWEEDLKGIQLLRGGDKRWEGERGRKDEEVGGRNRV